MMQNYSKKIFNNLLIFLFVLVPYFSFAQTVSFEGEYADITLINEHNIIVPGQESQILLHVELEEDWQSYWDNPGDTGFPASIAPDSNAVKIIGQKSQSPEIITYQEFVNYGYSDEFYILYDLKYADKIANNELTINLSAWNLTSVLLRVLRASSLIAAASNVARTDRRCYATLEVYLFAHSHDGAAIQRLCTPYVAIRRFRKSPLYVDEGTKHIRSE